MGDLLRWMGFDSGVLGGDGCCWVEIGADNGLRMPSFVRAGGLRLASWRHHYHHSVIDFTATIFIIMITTVAREGVRGEAERRKLASWGEKRKRARTRSNLEIHEVGRVRGEKKLCQQNGQEEREEEKTRRGGKREQEIELTVLGTHCGTCTSRTQVVHGTPGGPCVTACTGRPAPPNNYNAELGGQSFFSGWIRCHGGSSSNPSSIVGAPPELCWGLQLWP